MFVPIRTLEAIGFESLVLTNAAGSLLHEVGPGQIMEADRYQYDRSASIVWRSG